MPAFLLEIGLEEIPAGMIAAAQVELAQRIQKLLTREHLVTENLQVRSYSTPRRLAIVAEGLLPKQADLEEQVVGPSVAVAYKNGVPTPAATAFAKKSGVEVAALRTIQNAKGEYVAATVHRAGRSAAEVLASLIPSEIGGMYWPKNMYWRAGKTERFVRPVRWLLALLDEEILPIEFAGVIAAGVSCGHRILHGDVPVVVGKPQEYVEKLASAFVQVDPEARRHRIRKALDAATRQVPGARWREDEELVDIVTNLTEWPSVILGGFDPLGLPKEVLITVMRDHQKYFALEDAEGKLLPHFLAVLNIEVDPAGADIIRHGNERVLRARFNDARFFWDVDQKIPLVDRVEMLKNVTFHKDLGSYWDKTQWNKVTAASIAGVLSGDGAYELSEIRQAVELAKTDLTTEMVKEFTELQGIVGGLYARQQGLSKQAVDAIYQHYRPQGPKDEIPTTKIGAILALADKMTTITEMFKKDLIPSGSRDPFALRRAGAGVIRILAENAEVREHLHLVAVIQATNQLPVADKDLESRILTFMLDRLEFYLQESCGTRLQVARAVRNSGAAGAEDDSSDRLVGYGYVADFAKALKEQIGSPDILAVAELHKRASNILRQAREKGIDLSLGVSEDSLQHPAEIGLLSSLRSAFPEIWKNYRTGNCNAVIGEIVSLRQPLHQFFESVMVMTDDVQRRQARLWLVSYTKWIIGWAADFSELASATSS